MGASPNGYRERESRMGTAEEPIKLGRGPRRCLAILEARCGRTGREQNVSVHYLAAQLDVGTRTVHRYLEALRDAGIIERRLGVTRLVRTG